MDVPEWVKQAEVLYTQDLSFTEIGRRLKKDRHTVSQYLTALGYKSNAKFARKIPVDVLRKYDYSICDHVFSKIDTEEKAYWLGFLYADGTIARFKDVIELGLKEEDKEHIYKFRNFLGLNEKPIKKGIKRINGKEFISYRFSFNSAMVKQDLMRLGCIPQKTFSLKFPTEEQVPSHLIHHFIRGYIDGDGCICITKNKISVEVLGTEDFLTGYKKWVGLGHSKIYGFNHSSIKRVLNDNRQALDILKRIYTDATVYLERKHDKYLSFIAV